MFQNGEQTVKSFRAKVVLCVLIVVTLCLMILVYVLPKVFNTPTKDFPTGTTFTITEGMTINEITQLLGNNRVVKSPLYLYIMLTEDSRDTRVQAGEYTFTKPLTTREVTEAITHGEYLSPLITVTLPEGFKARDIYKYLPDNFKREPITLFEEKEGYLFPDTYFITSRMTAEEFRTLLLKTSAERFAVLIQNTNTSKLSEHEIITLASIIEREAKDLESKKMVSGILQNRLRLGMPLQVDAVFDYLLDKESAELTIDDLEMDSPFNTYKNTGLPPAPISNPGEESIDAVLNPTPSKYLYYLTDEAGVFHYAETFEEHKQNKNRYLK
jgi:UPF0755 protein